MWTVAEFLKDKILYVVISLGLSAGLIGAFGRERHEGRKPDSNWWISRLCIIPFLAITSTSAVDQFRLTNQQAAFLAAVLSLMGYEAVRMILERMKLKGDAALSAATDVVGGPAEAARPYHSVVDTDQAGRATAHVEQTDMVSPEVGAIRRGLQASFPPPPDDDDTAAELRGIIGDEI